MRNRNQKFMQGQGREPGMGNQGSGYQGSGYQGSNMQGDNRFSGSHPGQWQRPDYEQTQRSDHEASRYESHHDDAYGPRHLQGASSTYGGRDMNVDNFSHRHDEYDQSRIQTGVGFQGEYTNDRGGDRFGAHPSYGQGDRLGMGQGYGQGGERFGMQNDPRGGMNQGYGQGNFDRHPSRSPDASNWVNQGNRFNAQGGVRQGSLNSSASPQYNQGTYRSGQFGQLGGQMSGYDPTAVNAPPQGMKPQFRGPKGYTRSDERIKEDVSDCLGHMYDIDASDVEVSVSNGEVTLSGTIAQRYHKHTLEDAVDNVAGVKDVINNIRVKSPWSNNDTSVDKTQSAKTLDTTKGTEVKGTFENKAPDDRMGGLNNGNRRSNIDKHS